MARSVPGADIHLLAALAALLRVLGKARDASQDQLRVVYCPSWPSRFGLIYLKKSPISTKNHSIAYLPNALRCLKVIDTFRVCLDFSRMILAGAAR